MAADAHVNSARKLSWRRMRPRTDSVLVLLLIAVVGFLFVYPVATMILAAFRTAAPGLAGHFTVDGFMDAFLDHRTWETLKVSAIYSVLVQVFTLTLAAFFAWVVTRTTTPLRRLVTPMMIAVFTMPTIFFAVAWGLLGQKPTGLINKLYDGLPLVDGSIMNVESWYGMVGVTVLKMTAIMYFLFLGAFKGLNRSFEEASRISGAGKLQTVLRVELTLLAPAITGIAILGLIAGLSILDVPLVIGLPAGIHVFPTEVLGHIMVSVPSDYAGASTLSMILIALVIVLVLVQRRLLGHRSYVTMTGKSDGQSRWNIGRWGYLCSAVILLYGLLAVILPLAQIVLGSLQPFFGLYSTPTLDHYRAALSNPDVIHALRNTIMIGVLGGLLASTVAVVISYVGVRSRSRLRGVPSMAVWILLAAPGVTLSFAFLWAYLAVPGLSSLYATIWIIILAVAVYTVPLASRATEGSIAQVSRELEEAARTCGASAKRTLLDVTGRLIAPSFIIGWFVAGVLAAGNLDIPILLSSTDNMPVTVYAYTLYDNGTAALASAVFCLMMGTFIAVAVVGWALAKFVRLANHRRNGGARLRSPLPATEQRVMTDSAV